MEVTDFIVEDLLDLPNGDDIMNDTFLDNSCGGPTGHSTDSSTVTAVDSSCNSSSVSGTDANLSPTDYLCRSFADAKFSSELCVPYDDMAELEWLSKFVEESFSTDDLHNHNHNHRAPPFHHTTATHPQQHHQQQSLLSAPPQQFRPNTTHHHYPPPPHLLHPDVTTVPGKARSKISRVAPSDWSTRLLMVTSQPPQSAATSNSSSDTTTTDPDATIPHHKRHGKKRETSVSPGHCNGNNGSGGVEPGRRCLHCAAEKTPQWRTGPMGPKTLCNACGVRYKSGRLVPEYRPAASPTFVPTKHSNSHRKVLELRRQRDHVHRSYAGHGHHMMQQQHQQQQHQQHYMGQNGGGVYGNVGGDQYLIHHHMGPGGDHYRQMI